MNTIERNSWQFKWTRDCDVAEDWSFEDCFDWLSKKTSIKLIG